MDVVVPEGDGIRLIISQTGEDYVPSPVSTFPVSLSIGEESTLSLPSLDRMLRSISPSYATAISGLSGINRIPNP